MKLFITTLLFLIISTTGFSQALQKGNIDARAGLGFGIYNFKINSFESEEGAAVPGLLNVGLAYRITDDFSLGIDYERNGFATDADSNSKVVSHNFGITAGYSFLNSEKNVLTPFLQIGAGGLRFDNFDNQEYVTASGIQVQLGLAWNHYFGETFGMFANVSVPGYFYSKFKNSKGDVYEDSRVVIDNQGNASLETRVVNGTMTGVNIRLGLALKL